MSTPDLRDLPDAVEGELSGAAALTGCFSDERHVFILVWSPSGAALGLDGDALTTVDSTVVSQLVRRIVEMATRPEVPSGAQSTTSYAVSLRWTLVAPDGERVHGQVTFSSRDLHPDEIREILTSRPDLQARVPANAHAPAIALFDLAREITRTGDGQAASRPATVHKG